MKQEPDRPKVGILVPNDNGNFPFELWKDGRLIRGYPNFDDAKADCDSGNRQHKGYAIYKDKIQIWPNK